MYKLIVLALVGLAVSQRGEWRALDSVHEYRVEYLDGDNIFLFVSDSHCYIVETHSERWDEVVAHQDTLYKFTEAVYQQIHDQVGITAMTQLEATSAYHSRAEELQCRQKTIAKVTFVAPGGQPAATTTTTAGTTTMDPLDFLLPGNGK